MQYDPIKRSLGKVFNATPMLRVLFYKLLDVLLLRSWYIHRELRKWNNSVGATGISALDAGCGFGQYVYNLARLNKSNKVLGVDVKDEQVADCNGFFARLGMSERVRFEVQDLTTFSSPEAFNLILSVDVMEHILEDRKVFSNFFDSLAKGGMLLISTPSDLGGSDSDNHDEEAHGFVDEHVRDGYSISDITEKLTTAGFSHVEALYSYGTPGHIAWVLSMKWPIVAINATKLAFLILPFYYLAFMPICLILNAFDVCMKHSSGTGLIVKAIK